MVTSRGAATANGRVGARQGHMPVRGNFLEILSCTMVYWQRKRCWRLGERQGAAATNGVLAENGGSFHQDDFAVET